MFKAISVSIFVSIFSVYANADVTVAQMHFLVRNGNKVFHVQHFSKKNLYVINFGLLWSNFNQEVHSNGYNMAKTAGLQFVSPVLPEECYLSDPITVATPISGYINGVDGGSNMLQIALKGKSCEKYVEALKENNFIAEFKNVQALQPGASMTQTLRLEVIDLP